jgi:succinate dehydrogenase/fumarate reductase flavoprotein subunit
MNHRDRVSIALYEACQKSDVYLDLTRTPEKAWGQYPLNFLKRSRFPFRERPFLIAPAVHFFMGGIEIDDQGRTALAGLFAAGEVAWGIMVRIAWEKCIDGVCRFGVLAEDSRRIHNEGGSKSSFGGSRQEMERKAGNISKERESLISSKSPGTLKMWPEICRSCPREVP